MTPITSDAMGRAVTRMDVLMSDMARCSRWLRWWTWEPLSTAYAECKWSLPGDNTKQLDWTCPHVEAWSAKTGDVGGRSVLTTATKGTP